MATSMPAKANSPANISPVGPAPAISTACLVIATLRSAATAGRHQPADPRIPAARTPASARSVTRSLASPPLGSTFPRHPSLDKQARMSLLPSPQVLRLYGPPRDLPQAPGYALSWE